MNACGTEAATEIGCRGGSDTGGSGRAICTGCGATGLVDREAVSDGGSVVVPKRI